MTATLTDDARMSAQEALSSSPIYDLRSVQVERKGDTLYLSGQVTTFYHKQLAQEIVRPLADDLRVVNCLAVA